MKNTKLALALIALCSLSAQAADKGGLFIEPMLTYETGESEVDFPSPIGNSDSDYSGLGVGARLGFHIQESIFLGVDGRYSRISYENDDTDVDTEGSSYNFGPVIGFQMPTELGLRVWAGFVMGEIDLDEDNDYDISFEDGTGYRIGAGIKLSMVSLNLEYQNITYERTRLRNAGVFSGTTRNVEAENSSYVLSVSFPIAL